MGHTICVNRLLHLIIHFDRFDVIGFDGIKYRELSEFVMDDEVEELINELNGSKLIIGRKIHDMYTNGYVSTRSLLDFDYYLEFEDQESAVAFTLRY